MRKIENAWYVVILCGILFSYQMGAHFQTEYGEFRTFADAQKILLFVLKVVLGGSIGEFLLRKVILERLLRRITDIRSCLLIQALVAGFGMGIFLINTRNIVEIFVQILVAFSFHLLLGAIYISCRSILFTGSLLMLYLVTAYCAIGVYNGISLKSEISEHYTLYMLQIVYCTVAAMLVLWKQGKECTCSKLKRVVRIVFLIPILGGCMVMSFATAFYFTYYGCVNPIPQMQPVEIELPETYMIQHENRIDYQQGNECAGYATAYVMRNFGIECDGHTVYREFSNTTDEGANLVEIIKYFTDKNLNAKRYYGDLEHLKAHLIKGRPVIVHLYNSAFEKNLNGIKHFSVVVGYDEEHVYLADSLKFTGQTVSGTEYYNRVLDIDLFKKLWDFDDAELNSQWISNNYIVVE